MLLNRLTADVGILILPLAVLVVDPVPLIAFFVKFEVLLA